LGKPLRIFFATDLHASETCFRKFLRVPEIYGADAMIMGGDITGKQLVPVVKRADGSYVSHFLEEPRSYKSEADVVAFEELVRRSGSYPVRLDPQSADELNRDPEKLSQMFHEAAMETVARWVHLLEEKLGNSKTRVYVTGGNDDELAVNQIIDKSSFVMNADCKVLRVDQSHEIASVGYANMTPWKLPRDIPEEELTQKIESVLRDVNDMKNCIFNFHVPPVNSTLDTCMKLDTSLYPPKPITHGGQPELYGAGSTAVRQAIEKYQPLLGLHGHIHESPGVVKIGRTSCFNPGSEYSEGILKGLLLAVDEKGLKTHLFTTL
jgi:Icc-related predicted phosphoesterase